MEASICVGTGFIVLAADLHGVRQTREYLDILRSVEDQLKIGANMSQVEDPALTAPQRPLGLTVVLISGILTSSIGGLLLATAPFWISDMRQRLLELAVGAGALALIVAFCVGLWRHALWTRWFLAIVVYTICMLGLFFAFTEEDWVRGVGNAVRALGCLIAAVWYLQFNRSVTDYYAAIAVQREQQRAASAGAA